LEESGFTVSEEEKKNWQGQPQQWHDLPLLLIDEKIHPNAHVLTHAAAQLVE